MCRGDRLYIRRLKKDSRDRALAMARRYIEIAKSNRGSTREEFTKSASEVSVQVRDRRLAAGLQKLISDRCKFEMICPTDPLTLRREIFQKASTIRRNATSSRFERSVVLKEFEECLNVTKEQLLDMLYADLPGSHRLVDFDPIDPMGLVELYERNQSQAVLLRATRVKVAIESKHPGVYRAFFHKLKFLRLLHTIRTYENGGYIIEIDGPYSLFKSVTKYGLQLALLIPTLQECDRFKLDAELLWGKERKKLNFHLENKGSKAENLKTGQETDGPSDEVVALLNRFRALKTPWKAELSTEIVELPGVGLCIPDLIFTHEATGERVYFEVMGFWSRNAVWSRVDLVEAGLPQKIIFAVSKRLRVSEEVLDGDLPGSLYVYKGVMNAGQVAEKLESLSMQAKTENR